MCAVYGNTTPCYTQDTSTLAHWCPLEVSGTNLLWIPRKHCILQNLMSYMRKTQNCFKMCLLPIRNYTKYITTYFVPGIVRRQGGSLPPPTHPHSEQVFTWCWRLPHGLQGHTNHPALGQCPRALVLMDHTNMLPCPLASG